MDKYQHQRGLRPAGPVEAWNRAAASQEQHPAILGYRSLLATATIGAAARYSISREQATPALSVIIPAYNEEERAPLRKRGKTYPIVSLLK